MWEPAKIIFHIQVLVTYFFATPPITVELVQQINRWGGTTNSKPPGRIIMIGQSETRSSSQIVFIYIIFCRCTGLLYLLPATAKFVQLCWAKTNFLSQTLGYFDLFFSANFTAQDHILSTAGDALTQTHQSKKLQLPLVVSQTQFQRKQAKPNFNENKSLIVEWFCPLRQVQMKQLK